MNRAQYFVHEVGTVTCLPILLGSERLTPLAVGVLPFLGITWVEETFAQGHVFP